MHNKASSVADLHRAALEDLDQRRFAEARQHIEKALLAQPDSVDMLTTAGRIQNNSGDLTAAADSFARVVELQPDSADAWFKLGHVQQRLNKQNDAVNAFQRSLHLDSVNHNAQQRLGSLLLELGRNTEAVVHLREALNLQPGDAHAHYNLGLVLHELGRFDEAERSFERVIALQPNDADARSNLGAVMQSRGAFADAVTSFEAALAIDANHEPSLAAIAGIHDLRGEYDAGVELLESAMSRLSSPGIALHVALAQLLSRVDRRDEIPALLAPLIERYASDDADLMPALYTLGDYYDRAGEYEKAIEHITAANAMHRVPYDAVAHEAHIERLIDFFNSDRMRESARSKNTSDKPVFIVGMPRSGTSLVEQILASHSDIYGAGELNTIAQLVTSIPGADKRYPSCLAQVDSGMLDKTASEYIACLESFESGAKRVTDKMWHNFEYLGVIEMLFPKAHVIHCTRDPRDTGLSCYFQSFGVAGPPFSYDIGHIAHYYQQYRRLMAHWRDVLSIKVLELNYEALVADTEQRVRDMLEFIGLEWQPACLEFDKNRRVVRTASHAQVREPIYSRSVGRYKHYEEYIAPLMGLSDNPEP